MKTSTKWLLGIGAGVLGVVLVPRGEDVAGAPDDYERIFRGGLTGSLEDVDRALRAARRRGIPEHRRALLMRKLELLPPINPGVLFAGLLGDNELCWDERLARHFAVDVAERVLPIFEREFPDHKVPREALELARRFADDSTTNNFSAAYHARSKVWRAQDIPGLSSRAERALGSVAATVMVSSEDRMDADTAFTAAWNAANYALEARMDPLPVGIFRRAYFDPERANLEALEEEAWQRERFQEYLTCRRQP